MHLWMSEVSVPSLHENDRFVGIKALKIHSFLT